MQKNLLVIGFTWPEPLATAAGNRMVQLVQFFLSHGYEITFASTASSSDLSYDLEALGIESVKIYVNDSSFDRFIANLQPDVVLFDRFLTEEQFGWRVAEFAPQALRILDTEDLHSLRKARETAFKNDVECTSEFWLQTDLCKRELASIFRCDLSLIISSYEMQLLQEIVTMNSAILFYLPFMVQPVVSSAIDNWLPFERRTDFICIGNGKHAPNVDAFVWLKKDIWPMIREQLPDVQLHVYGAYLPAQILQMNHQKEGFLVHGWAAEVKEVMENAKVNLAPLRFGAGLKGKLIEAMCNGTPSVTTPVGAEGMHDAMAFAGFVATTAETFATRAVELYTLKDTWQFAQDNSVEIINSKFHAGYLQRRLHTKIEATRAGLEAHRSKNFVGQMLLHQTMACTKYMAKWIEAKNRGQ